MLHVRDEQIEASARELSPAEREALEEQGIAFLRQIRSPRVGPGDVVVVALRPVPEGDVEYLPFEVLDWGASGALFTGRLLRWPEQGLDLHPELGMPTHEPRVVHLAVPRHAVVSVDRRTPRRPQGVAHAAAVGAAEGRGPRAEVTLLPPRRHQDPGSRISAT